MGQNLYSVKPAGVLATPRAELDPCVRGPGILSPAECPTVAVCGIEAIQVGAMNVDVLVGLAMLVGLVGTVVPFLPGLPVIVVAAFVWVIVDGSDPGQWIVFAIVASIAVAAIAVGTIVPVRRTSAAGASRWILAAGALGLVIGAIAIPVVGALVGWPIGIFAAEVLRTRDVAKAWAMTRVTVAAVGLGVAIQFGAGVIAVAVWAIAAWRW